MTKRQKIADVKKAIYNKEFNVNGLRLLNGGDVKVRGVVLDYDFVCADVSIIKDGSSETETMSYSYKSLGLDERKYREKVKV